MSDDGYIYSRESNDNFFQKNVGNVSWLLSFHLWGGGPYYFMDHLRIRYNDLSTIIYDLLKNTEFEKQIASWGINVGTHVSNYWSTPHSREISQIDGVEIFASDFLGSLRAAESDFLIPYSDVTKVVHECTLFYTKWPREMGPFKTSFCLIAYGIQKGEIDKVQLGIERIAKKIDMCQSDQEKNLMLALRQKAIETLGK